MCPARAFGAVNFSDHTVPGVTPRGTTIDLFDYWLNGRGDPDDQLTGQQEIGINLGHSLFFGKNMAQVLRSQRVKRVLQQMTISITMLEIAEALA